MLPSTLHFAAMLLLVGMGFRMVQYLYPDSPVAKALAVIY